MNDKLVFIDFNKYMKNLFMIENCIYMIGATIGFMFNYLNILKVNEKFIDRRMVQLGCNDCLYDIGDIDHMSVICEKCVRNAHYWDCYVKRKMVKKE